MTGNFAMPSSPLVTVVTPFVNVEAYLPECIDSVLSQTFTDWELVLVDDGCTDRGPEIARQYARMHPERIRLVEHPGHVNRGISTSRNLGRRHARGQWIASLDADDVWLPNKLEEQIEILRRYPEVGMIVGASHYWFGWTGCPGDIARDKVIEIGAPQDSVVEPPLLSRLLYPLGKGAAPCPTSAVVRADIVDRLGGWEDGVSNCYEDQYFFAKVCLEIPVYVSSKCWDFYRQRADSAMHTAFSAEAGYHTHRRHFFEWFERYLAARGLTGTPIWTDLQRALRPYRHPKLHRAQDLAQGAIRRILRAGRDS